MKVNPQKLLSSVAPSAILVRLTIAAIILLVLAIYFSEFIAISLLPLYRTAFQLIDNDFQILSLGLSMEGADRVIRLNVTLSHAIAVAGHLVMANPAGIANASTLIGNIFQPVTVGLVAVLAWPSHSLKNVSLRLMVLILLTLIETTLDIPLLLEGNLWGVLLDNLSPGSWSPLTAWADFLQVGGRYALGLVAALASIAASDTLPARLNLKCC